MARTKDFDEDEVLKKAITLFWHKGYNGTSMQDLVDRLGISRSSLYDTYGDKHTLFIKALDSYKRSAAEKMQSIIDHSASAKDAIKQLLEMATGDLIRDKQHKGCFLLNTAVEVAPHDKEVSNMIRQNDQQIEGFFYDAVMKGQASGGISNRQDARALARFIFNTVKGIRVSAKATTDKNTFDDIIKLTLLILDQ